MFLHNNLESYNLYRNNYPNLLHMSSQDGQNKTSLENFPRRKISAVSFPHF